MSHFSRKPTHLLTLQIGRCAARAMCIKDRGSTERAPSDSNARGRRGRRQGSGVTGRFVRLSSQPFSLSSLSLSHLHFLPVYLLCVLNINLHLIQREAPVYGWGWHARFCTLHPPPTRRIGTNGQISSIGLISLLLRRSHTWTLMRMYIKFANDFYQQISHCIVSGYIAYSHNCVSERGLPADHEKRQRISKVSNF